MLKNIKEFSLPEIEKKILEFWAENKIFERSLEKTKKGKPFTFYDGPPFATGLPHYGHILASTIKDVIPRYQTMKGRFVRRRWGWDCHGLPIEEIVERSLGISGKKEIEKLGIGKFNATCREKVLQFADEWGKMVRRIARWVDFDNSYKTMDRDYMESVWWAFKQIYDKGLVYEGRKVLMYCPRCETPVSNFEVAMDNSYKNVTEDAVFIKFKIQNSKFKDAYLLAWTTTPWTLPGNVALAVGPEIEYVKVKTSQFREVRPPKIEGNVRRSNLQNIEFYILAKERLSVIQEPLEIVQEVKGKDLVGLNYEPLFDVPAVKSKNSYKVYPADFVTTDEGTGVVHTAVVYGEEDYELGVKVGLPVVPLLDEKGIFNDKAPTFLRGKYFKKADQMIIENLEKRKLLFKKEKHTHSYPHCWRCETPLFYNAIPAWFINIQKIKKKIIESNKKEINWFPEHLKRGRYENSVKDAPDWNISRNRYWGNPIPIWRCEKCSNLQCIGSLNELDRFAHHKSGNAYFLLRHGEADSNVTGTISMDVKDSVHLTDYGRKQVVKASKKLVSFGIDHIFSSDLTRTKETAEIVAEKLGIKPKYDARLRELNHGEFNGRKIDEYLSYYRERGWNRVDYAVPGGETLPQVRARLMSFFKELEEKYRGKRILIIGHGDPLWVLERTLFGWNDEDFRRVDKVSQPYPEYPEKGEIRKVLRWNLPRDEQGMANLHRPYIDEIVLSCSKCGGKAVRIKEIFDSWFEAGSMPFAEYHYPFENKKTFKNRFPAQFVAEYIAQTRAWFYVMHVVSLVLFGKAPFENVVTTGTILAEDGSKMSKSKGNFPDPWKVIERYGVDALRFYLMNSSVMRADDLNFSEKEVEKIYRKNILILWNVYRYFETYSHVVKNSKFEIRNSKLTNVLDVWIEARTKELINLVTGYLDIYDTVRATRAIEEYINDLSTWYVRRSRGRQDASFFATLHDSLIKTSQVIAPFMPYLAEVLYLNLTNGNESVHLTDWPKTEKLTESEKTFLHEMSEARRLASLALAKRAEAGIKVRQPLASLKINPRRFDFPKIGGNVKRSNLLELLKDEINIKEIIFDPKIIEEIELETEITHELKEEGWLREFKRLVQGLRKDAGLYPKDEIVLVVELPEELNHVVQKNENLIKKEVNAKSVEYGRSHKFESELETKIDDYPVWVGLRKPL